jgi:outer membrane receptor protein involved in Fe transport
VYTAAPAQTDSEEEAYADETVLEEVIVTGTRIKRRDFSSPSPLLTISREDFAFSGQPTLEDYLNQMPQMSPVSGRAVNNGSDGTAQLDLRSLGPGRTLVMLNGRRLAPSNVGSAVDVNNLPSTLIDRVEIITGGASTVYGSDAIAGVVNFITRDDFEGLSFEGGYNVTEEGDADIWDANVVWGQALGNGGHITAYAGRYERETLFASERERTNKVWTDDFFTGQLVTGGSTAIPAGRISGPQVDLGSGLTQVTFNPDGTPRPWSSLNDRYNFAPINYLQTPQSRDTLGVFGQLPLSGGNEFYFEASYAKNDVELSLAPSPFFGFLLINTDNPVLAPAAQALFERPEFEAGPGLAGFSLSSRLEELGPRILDYERKYQRLVAGIRGDLFSDWAFDAWLTYTDSRELEANRNDASRSRIQQGMLVNPATGECFDPSGGCVPVNLFGVGNLSEAAAAFIRAQDALSSTKRSQWLASAVVTGAPFEIWSGPVDMAFGVEYRRDEAAFQADERLFSGDMVGFVGAAPVNGTESVYELYSEAVMTLVEGGLSGQKLDLEVGARWSDYDNAGQVTTWKAGLDWLVTDSLRFRTMLQHAVRAPNNSELFTAQFSETFAWTGDFFPDPCSASQDPVGAGIADKCVLQGLPASQVGVFEHTPFYPTVFTSGGNPSLAPEASDTFTFGLVYNPAGIPELTIAVDYYDLEVTDTIGEIDPGVICFDPLNTTGVYCENLRRDSTGNVSKFLALTENRGVLATDGVDVQLQYQADLPASLSLVDDIAQLSLNATLTHVLSLKSQENVVSQVIDCNGLFGWPCGLAIFGAESFPENRMTANFNYASGPFSTHLTWRWIEGMVNAAPIGLELFGISDPILAIQDIPAWNYYDLGFSWRWDESVEVRFGINNLFDKEPPLMSDWVFNNTDTKLYDVFGRTYYLNLRYQITED